jgi:hypothetical protein
MRDVKRRTRLINASTGGNVNDVCDIAAADDNGGSDAIILLIVLDNDVYYQVLTCKQQGINVKGRRW